VPDPIFKSPKSVALAFLAGIFDTDGAVGDLTLCSKSRGLIGDIAMLLGMLGLQGSIEESWNKPYARMYYKLRLRRASTLRFVSMGGMRAPGKLVRQQAKMAAWGTRARVETPLVAGTEIIRVEPVLKQRVYDIPEKGYVANGLVSCTEETTP